MFRCRHSVTSSLTSLTSLNSHTTAHRTAARATEQRPPWATAARSISIPSAVCIGGLGNSDAGMAANAAEAAPGVPVAAAAAVNSPVILTDELKEQFKKKLVLTAVRVPKQSTNQYMKLLSKHLFNQPRLRNVVADGSNPDSRLLLLEASVTEADLESLQMGGDPPRTLSELITAEGLEITTAVLDVDYSYWPAHTVLQRLLPEGIEVPSSFETVGHIAHVNLREELLAYKHIIGQVILDKNPRLQTVVNKVASIVNEFRVFPMEILAGQECTETEVRQHGARFKLDFSKVYWNSRLEREHQRLVEQFHPGEVVLDAMAGIGPFAIPAASKGCLVYANDLNPASYHYLCANIKLNRLGGKVLPFQADGREFMRQAAAGKLNLVAAAAVVPAPNIKPPKPQQQQQQPALAVQAREPAAVPGVLSTQQQHPAQPTSASGRFQHIVMNLPAAAIEFLDALHGSFSRELWEGQPLPLVHVYTFAKGEEELAGVVWPATDAILCLQALSACVVYPQVAATRGC